MVDSKPPHGSNTDITNLHECIQTLDSSAGTSINVQEEQNLDLSASTPFNLKKERIKAWIKENVYLEDQGKMPLTRYSIIEIIQLSSSSSVASAICFSWMDFVVNFSTNTLFVSPTMEASYLASLLVAVNSNFRAYVNFVPSGMTTIRPAPEPSPLDAPSEVCEDLGFDRVSGFELDLMLSELYGSSGYPS
ncbi:hypothetical protein Tco_0271719 [Tanacetum coccineum]